MLLGGIQGSACDWLALSSPVLLYLGLIEANEQKRFVHLAQLEDDGR